MYAKGSKPQDLLDSARGGPALGRTREFLKEGVEFRDPDEGKRQSADVVGDTADEDQKYGKSGPGQGTGCMAPLKARSKPLPAIKPRS